MKQLVFLSSILFSLSTYAELSQTEPAFQPTMVCSDINTEVRVYEEQLKDGSARVEIEAFQDETPEVLFTGAAQVQTERGHSLYSSNNMSLFIVESEAGLHGVLNMENKPEVTSKQLDCTPIYTIQPIENTQFE